MTKEFCVCDALRPVGPGVFPNKEIEEEKEKALKEKLDTVFASFVTKEKYEELFLLWQQTQAALDQRDMEIKHLKNELFSSSLVANKASEFLDTVQDWKDGNGTEAEVQRDYDALVGVVTGWEIGGCG